MSLNLSVEFGLPRYARKEIAKVQKQSGASDRQALGFYLGLGIQVERAAATKDQEIYVQRADTGEDTKLELFGIKRFFGNPVLDRIGNYLDQRGWNLGGPDLTVQAEVYPYIHLGLLTGSQLREISIASYARELTVVGVVLDRAIRSPRHNVWVPGERGTRQLISINS